MRLARVVTVLVWLFSSPHVAQAGMPTVTLHDMTRMRFQAISFFLLVLLLSTWGVQRIWNTLAADFPKLPRLTFGKAAGVVVLWGLLFVIVLTMISGARELMTPGAWEKNGATYRLKPDAPEPPASAPEETLHETRRAGLQRLGLELLHFAAAHDGRFPTADEAAEIDADVWACPGQSALRYLYQPGLTSADEGKILAIEPAVFEDEQFVLFAGGEVRQMPNDEIRSALPPEEAE